jgi:UDP-glucose 4-epimerase
MLNILVTGGAGYIGSHVARDLEENGYHAIVLDNLSEGRREACQGRTLVQGSIGDSAVLETIFSNHRVDAVMHFSAFAYVGESVTNPEKYYVNNVSETIALLRAMRNSGVHTFIFSSSCATYGNPEYIPIDENHPQNPVNPYGRTKLMVEKILEDYGAAYGLKYAALRYFNAAGAHPDGSMGESHRVETHLIPLALQAIKGVRESVSVFGSDYDTEDGTCVRDYIHVCDLAKAHRFALEALLNAGESMRLNLGTGRGHSVRQIIGVCEEVTGKKAPVTEAPRRKGDPPVLVACGAQARKTLAFSPDYTDIREIIKTAWQWETRRRY